MAMGARTFVVVLALVGLSGLCGAAWSRTRVPRESGSDAESVGSQRSPVRVLRSDDELQEAMERALRYDRVAEAALLRRIDRYTQSGKVAAAAVINLPTRGSTEIEGIARQKATA